MARKERIYEDDDGRTIADMSGVTRRNLFSLRIPSQERKERESAPVPQPNPDRPWENKNAMSREDRRSYILGALGASLLIGMTYAVVLGLAILLISKLYS